MSEEKYNVYHDNDRLYPLADELTICFSEFLENKGIIFINEDTDEHQMKNKCAIYGEDFRILQDMVQTVLDKHIKDKGVKINMKLKYVGFGGYGEYPCYEDENGKVYFDINNGKNGLNIYSGAYKDEFGEICGEPCSKVNEPIECDEPFIRHPREFDYMMLGRLITDCNYFLGNGNGYEGHLYYKDVNTHYNKMLELYNSFSDEDKPQWITVEKIEQYRKDMLAKKSE